MKWEKGPEVWRNAMTWNSNKWDTRFESYGSQTLLRTTITRPGPHCRPIQRECLGAGPRHQYFLKTFQTNPKGRQVWELTALLFPQGPNFLFSMLQFLWKCLNLREKYLIGSMLTCSNHYPPQKKIYKLPFWSGSNNENIINYLILITIKHDKKYCKYQSCGKYWFMPDF